MIFICNKKLFRSFVTIVNAGRRQPHTEDGLKHKILDKWAEHPKCSTRVKAHLDEDGGHAHIEHLF